MTFGAGKWTPISRIPSILANKGHSINSQIHKFPHFPAPFSVPCFIFHSDAKNVNLGNSAKAVAKKSSNMLIDFATNKGSFFTF